MKVVEDFKSVECDGSNCQSVATFLRAGSISLRFHPKHVPEGCFLAFKSSARPCRGGNTTLSRPRPPSQNTVAVSQWWAAIVMHTRKSHVGYGVKTGVQVMLQ